MNTEAYEIITYNPFEDKKRPVLQGADERATYMYLKPLFSNWNPLGNALNCDRIIINDSGYIYNIYHGKCAQIKYPNNISMAMHDLSIKVFCNNRPLKTITHRVSGQAKIFEINGNLYFIVINERLSINEAHTTIYKVDPSKNKYKVPIWNGPACDVKLLMTANRIIYFELTYMNGTTRLTSIYKIMEKESKLVLGAKKSIYTKKKWWIWTDLSGTSMYYDPEKEINICWAHNVGWINDRTTLEYDPKLEKGFYLTIIPK